DRAHGQGCRSLVKAAQMQQESVHSGVGVAESNPARAYDGAVEPRSAADSHAQLVRWMGIVDANSAGFVHGGTVMKLCDEAAGLASIKHSRCRVVTAGMDRMTFLQPVHVGDLLTFSASVNAAWRTSMEIGVRVEAENPRTGEVRHTSTAYLT